ncbi:MAG: hypothetical protein FWF52_00935 [Candidatus Azobacteroides sp.]|nr:hypothetical protein [Candidatus Azobacteroides sp.]
MELAKQSAEWKRVKSDPNYSDLKDDNAIANEVLSSLYGNRGEEIFKEKGIGEKLREWVNKVWGWIKSKLGIRNPGIRDLTPEQIQNLTLKQFVDMSVGELLNGKRIVPEKPTYKGGDVLGFAKEVNDWNKKNLENGGKSSNLATENKKKGIENDYRGKQFAGESVSRMFAEAKRELDAATTNRGGIQTTRRKQQNIGKAELLGNLERLAKKHGAWIEDPQTIASPKLLSSGFESEVFMSVEGKDVIKYNNLAVSETLDQFLNRIKAHNEFEPKAPYIILGIGKNSKGETSVILQQPFIEAKPAPLEKVMQFLKNSGFRPARLSNGAEGFKNDQYEISDLWKNDGSMKADNVLIDEEGNLYFIDTDINHIDHSTPSLLHEPAVETQLHWEEEKEAISNLPEGEGLPDEAEGSVTYVERILSEQKGITFMGDRLTGKVKIKTSQDVAFLFKNLESAASENVFCVLHKADGAYTVLYISTGTATEAHVDIKQIEAAAKETGAVGVTLVHNHPSGSLQPSDNDIAIHRAMEETLSLSVNPSVIIDLDSGRYGVFTSSSQKEMAKKKTAGRVEEAKVYQFDRLKLYENSGERQKIANSGDIAEFLSRHKRGTADKMQLIVVDGANRITRYTLLEEGLSWKELLSRIIAEAGKYGNGVILVSNGQIEDNRLPSLKRKLVQAHVRLVDALTVRQSGEVLDRYRSAFEAGWLRDTPETYADTVRSPSVDKKGNPNTEAYRKALDAKIDRVVLGLKPFRLAENIADQYLAVKKFEETLRKAGIEIADYNDFYLQATHLSGKNDAQLEEYNERLQKPLNLAVKALEEAGFSYREIENYAILKHGLERNAFMTQKALAEGKTPWADYSGVSAVEAETGQRAEDFIAAFEQQAGKDRIDDFWEKVKAATVFSLRKQLEGGNIGKQTLDALTDRFQYYIPLRGHDDITTEDRWDYSPEEGTYFTKTLQKITGRTTRSETPFAYIWQMAQSSIVSANRNVLNQTLLRLARKDTTGLMSVNKTWYVNGQPQEAAYSENPETYRQNIEDFEKQMENLEALGFAKREKGKLDVGGLFITDAQKDQHAVRVRQNGQEYTIYINGNPAVSRAINEQNVHFIKDLNPIARGTRWIAANLTTRNPEFVIRNFTRDYLFASSLLPIKEGLKYTLAFQKNIPASAGAWQRHLRGKGDISIPEDRYLAEYIMNGGKTGYSHLLELKKVQKRVEQDVRNGNGKNLIRHLSDSIGAMNDFAENLTRFAVYLASRKAGRSIIQSVSDAKEVTVNFNRRGAGRHGVVWINALYLYTNAAVQALSNFMGYVKAHPGRVTALTLFYSFTGSVLAPALASLLGGEDEYWLLSDWERQSNFCIYTGNGTFIKIPLPQELRVFHALGDHMLQALLGKKDGSDALLDSLGNFADLLPVDPAGAVYASYSDLKRKDAKQAAATLAALLSPDILKTGFQLAANRNFMGGPIIKEHQKPYRPGYTKVRTNKKGEAYAPLWLVDLSKAIDQLTGGDGVEGGLVSLHPDVAEHFLKSGYVSGIYNIFSGCIETAYRACEGKNIELRDTPVKNFFTAVSDTEQMSRGENEQYYNVMKEAETNLSKAKDYQKQVKAGELGIVQYNEKLQRLEYEKSFRIHEQVKQIKKLEKLLPEADEEMQRQLEEKIIGLKREVIEMGRGK